jgi:hypothetical protein
LNILNGIKSLAMLWIIFAHVAKSSQYSIN